MKNIVIAAALVLPMGLSASPVVLAEDGVCVIKYVRTACQGQEVESFSKCDGKAECEKTQTADSTEACAALALEACANSRLDITKYKTITARFSGTELKGGFDAQGNADPTGANFCDKNRTDLNQCD